MMVIIVHVVALTVRHAGARDVTLEWSMLILGRWCVEVESRRTAIWTERLISTSCCPNFRHWRRLTASVTGRRTIDVSTWAVIGDNVDSNN